MNNYTIYCSKEQIEKAFELGAPIETLPNYTEYKVFPLVKLKDGNERRCIIPTAEQMIGWLEKQENIKEVFVTLDSTIWRFAIITKHKIIDTGDFYNSRKEATLAAINIALEHLRKESKEQ